MLLANAPVKLRRVDTIYVDRESRQRSTMDKDVAVLADQMARSGQINPIVIHADGKLVAGERRWLAAQRNKWEELKVTEVESLPKHEAFLIELLENIARRDLSWQDQAKAMLSYHEMRASEVAGWNAKATSMDLGFSEPVVSINLRVACKLSDPEVSGCQTLQGAFNLLRGRSERAVAAATSRGLDVGKVVSKLLGPKGGSKEERTAALEEELLSDEPSEPAMDILDAGAIAEEALRAAAVRELASIEVDTSSGPIITADLLEWLPEYGGLPFDVLHVDFPYGKGYTGSNTRRTGRAHVSPRYADNPDVLWELLEALLTHQDRIAYPVAHCLFWFDMQHYSGIVESFSSAGWTLVQPYPLIWAKPYQGVASDPRRRPRHCYETALLFSRGDRKIIRLEQDYFEGRKDEGLHISQKSLPMLKHFLKLLVDEHTAVFDPTCGSGTALAAARQLGAKRILGLELDASNAEVARFVLDRPAEEEEL